MHSLMPTTSRLGALDYGKITERLTHIRHAHACRRSSLLVEVVYASTTTAILRLVLCVLTLAAGAVTVLLGFAEKEHHGGAVLAQFVVPCNQSTSLPATRLACCMERCGHPSRAKTECSAAHPTTPIRETCTQAKLDKRWAQFWRCEAGSRFFGVAPNTALGNAATCSRTISGQRS